MGRKNGPSPRISADRLRTGWHGPAGTRIRLARAQDTGAADALMATAGDGMALTPAVRAAIEAGTAASAMLAGLGSVNTFHDVAAAAFMQGSVDEGFPLVCLTLVAADTDGETVGVLSATAPGTVMEMAVQYGFDVGKAAALSLFVAKVHGVAVAEPVRGRGVATALLKRTWQVYEQLGYQLLYGSYEADRDLRGLYTRCGYTVHAPGESFPLEHRLPLPFGLHAGPDQCMFSRWRSLR